MNTYIFVNSLRYDKLKYHKFKQDNDRFVLITEEERVINFPEKHKYIIDKFITIDPETSLIEIIDKAVFEEISNNGGNVFLCTADELFVLECAQIRSKYNLYGEKQLDCFRNKKIMKDLLQGYGILPKYKLFDYFIPEKGYPFILKPIQGLGGIETYKINTPAEFLHIVSQLKINENYLLEEYVDGTLFHCDSFIKNGEVVFSGICRCIGNGISLAKDGKYASIVVNSSFPLYKDILSFNNAVISRLPLQNGVTHCEFFITPDNKIVFVEIAARPPGGEICGLYELTYGVNLLELSMLADMNRVDNLSISINNKYQHAGFAYIGKKTGTISKINLPKFKAEYQNIEVKVKQGQQYTGSIASYDRAISIILADNDSRLVDTVFDNFDWGSFIKWE